MIKGKVSVSSKVDNRKQIMDAIKKASGMQVYVGIPENDAQRGDVQYNATHERKVQQGAGNRTGGQISNAELLYLMTNGVRSESMRQDMKPNLDNGMSYSRAYDLYIHSNGSALWKIPPRPVLEPAIEHNKAFIAEQLKKVVDVVLDGRDPTQALQRAGMMGQNIARDWFTNPNNGWSPNSPRTIKEKGSDKPLIDTGQLRKSITYAVIKND